MKTGSVVHYLIKNRAHHEVGKAIQDGLLVRPDHCSECHRKGIINGHHNDYSKPLEVEWLCCSCHRKRHPKSKTGRISDGRKTITVSVVLSDELYKQLQALAKSEKRSVSNMILVMVEDCLKRKRSK